MGEEAQAFSHVPPLGCAVCFQACMPAAAVCCPSPTRPPPASLPLLAPAPHSARTRHGWRRVRHRAAGIRRAGPACCQARCRRSSGTSRRRGAHNRHPALQRSRGRPPCLARLPLAHPDIAGSAAARQVANYSAHQAIPTIFAPISPYSRLLFGWIFFCTHAFVNRHPTHTCSCPVGQFDYSACWHGRSVPTGARGHAAAVSMAAATWIWPPAAGPAAPLCRV